MSNLTQLEKTPTGTSGLDEILAGGLPRGRPTLVAGAAGCGKTLLGMQFLVRGALDYGEPGVFLAFEEREADLRANVASLGFDLAALEAENLLALDHVVVDPANIIESGEYDLSGLFLRLELAINTIGAKRVVIDTLETVFGGLSNYALVRAELRRLFDWLKAMKVTAIITAERGDNALTRYGLEEYVSDCVVSLDHRVDEQISTRRLRVIKYRGSVHGTNEYPFLIDETGICVLPITSAGLNHEVLESRVSSGIPKLDKMLGGSGYFEGSTILVSGTAGCGKTSVAAHFAQSVCQAGGKTLFFSFEESPHQIVRNMRSIGLSLSDWLNSKQLGFVSSRPTAHGIETHLAIVHKHVREFNPTAVVVDPASNLMGNSGDGASAHQMLVRLIDYLKSQHVTVLLTTVTSGGAALEQTTVDISSIVDSWLLLKAAENGGERNRTLQVLKSRGMNHSNQVREFNITSTGIELTDVYIGPEGVLTGSARMAQAARERAAARLRRAEIERKQRKLENVELAYRERRTLLEAEYEEALLSLRHEIDQAKEGIRERESDEADMARYRWADAQGGDHV